MYEEIIKALKSLGATVDEQKFGDNMSKPDFAEKVRSSLQSAGASVPDSATFYRKYSSPSFEQSTKITNSPAPKKQEPVVALNRPVVDGTIVKSNNKPREVSAVEKTINEHFSPSTLYKGLRGITGFIPSMVGAIGKGVQGAYVAEPGKRLEGFNDSASAAMERNIEDAEENRGVIGALGDPINLAMLIPGPGEAVMATKGVQGLIKAAGKAGPYVGRAIKYTAVPAAENAALTAASGVVDPTKQFDKGDVLTSGALGAALGFGGRVAQKWAIELFPGANKAIKAELAMNGGKSANATSKVKNQIENDLMKKVEGAGGRGSYENMANKLRESSSDKYDEVFTAVEPKSAPTDDIFDIMLNKSVGESNALTPQQIKQHIKSSLNEQAPELGLTVKEVDKITDDYMSRLLDNSAGGTNTPLVTPRELQSSKKWLSGEIYNNRASDMAVTKRQGARAIKEGIDKALDDILKNVPNKELARDLQTKITSAKTDYAKYKTIDDFLEKHGATDGSSWRFGHDGVAKYTKTGPMYLPQTNLYRAGALGQRGLAAAVVKPSSPQDKTKR